MPEPLMRAGGSYLRIHCKVHLSSHREFGGECLNIELANG